MIIRFTSTNPNALDILKKNPESFSGIQLRSHKNGVAIGRIISAKIPIEYHMIFQDTKYSYSQDSSNQIDFQSYCNPRAALGLIGELLRHVLVSDQDWRDTDIPWLNSTIGEVDTRDFNHTIIVDNLYADGFNLDGGLVLEKYFKEISLKRNGQNQFELKIDVCRDTIHYTINLLAFVCMYLAATNKQPWYLNRDIASKYIRVLENIGDVPYFILYLFARSCLPSEELFNEFAPRLENIFYSYDDRANDLTMVYGNTQSMRLRSISDLLLTNDKIFSNIIEIGCGDGDYPRRLAKKLNNGLSWWSYDIEDHSYLNRKIPEMMGKLATFKFTQEWDQIPLLDNPIVLLVEVIEHMSVEEAIELICRILDKHSPTQLIITTPNRTFNNYYRFDPEDDGFRHSDHNFEMTQEQFKEYILSIIKLLPYDASFFGIGDRIDADYTTQGVVLTRKDPGSS